MMDTIAIHRLAGPASAAEDRLALLRRTDAMALPNETESPDCELAIQFAAGDTAAVEQVVGNYQNDLTRLARRMLGWQHDAAVDDLVQEVFVKAIESRHKFNGSSTLKTWLTSIAVNECRALLRKQNRRAKLLRLWHAALPINETPAADHQPQQDETTNQVRQAIAQLKPGYREVVVLHYLEELPLNEVALALGVKPGAAATRLGRARNALRKLLDEELGNE